MRLKKLILQGFKSFADRTEFVFDSPITGIVGPNGCGKSNVVDGFKWVLGEQSAKSLRGEAMLDVIFNGAAGRKPSGMSEVVLVFENPKREDAARISKYKQKKKEAQRKLEKVDQNLLRVTDIVEEVEKRLRSVKIQAGRARTFQEYSTRLRELRLTYALQEYHTQQEQLKELDAKREDAQFRLDDQTTDLQRTQNELAAKREQFEKLSEKKQQAEYELVQAKAAMQSAQQRQQYAENQLAQIDEQIATFDQDKANLE